MKPYADAGLGSLAKVAGHRGETLTSLLQASNFRRTHEFLLQVFEVFYRYFLSVYYSHAAARRPIEQREHFDEDINALLSKLLDQFSGIACDQDLESFRLESAALFSGNRIPVNYGDFVHFMQRLSEHHETIRFWYQFISQLTVLPT